ncbi:MAG: hypothetical protein Q4C78_02620 [Synergistaceae bacterium]|nr:hypothetical protein [Synergistaceae bacterium]
MKKLLVLVMLASLVAFASPVTYASANGSQAVKVIRGAYDDNLPLTYDIATGSYIEGASGEWTCRYCGAKLRGGMHACSGAKGNK